MSEGARLFLGYYLPYLPACGLALFAESRAARRLVVFYSLAFLVLMSITLLGSAGCRHDNFMFHDCALVGQAIAFGLSLLIPWLMVTHFLLSPLVAGVALTLEWRSRRARRP